MKTNQKTHYTAVLCKSRHDIRDVFNRAIEHNVFPQECTMDMRNLQDLAVIYMSKLHTMLDETYGTRKKAHESIILDVYVTGFTPALIALVNVRNLYYKDLPLILWHYDMRIKGYIPQVVI